MLELPFIVCLQQHGADQANDGAFVGKDADDLGAALDLAVEPFERVCNRYERAGAEFPAASGELAAYGATIRDRGAGSTKVWAGRSIR